MSGIKCHFIDTIYNFKVGSVEITHPSSKGIVGYCSLTFITNCCVLPFSQTISGQSFENGSKPLITSTLRLGIVPEIKDRIAIY